MKRKVNMNEKEIRKIIKDTIEGVLEEYGVKPVKIILFGSRARGDYREDSDWDILVIVDKELDREKKREIIARIRIKLASLKIPNDIIIQSSLTVEKRKNDVGYLTYYVLKEGVEL